MFVMTMGSAPFADSLQIQTATTLRVACAQGIAGNDASVSAVTAAYPSVVSACGARMEMKRR